MFSHDSRLGLPRGCRSLQYLPPEKFCKSSIRIGRHKAYIIYNCSKTAFFEENAFTMTMTNTPISGRIRIAIWCAPSSSLETNQNLILLRSNLVVGA